MPADELDAREAAYESFLAGRRATMPPDLWSYFAWDVFHDGGLEELSWNREMDSLQLELSCPNIKRFEDSGEYEFVNVSFRCTFQGVSYQDVDMQEDGGGVGSFIGAEIDAEADLLTRAKERLQGDHHSLLIEFEHIVMRIVFRDLSVDAVDPASFELMRQDPNYVIPTAP